ncbi:hypothetical protein C5167_039866 [Papaver somniferum]|uniref:Fe2OG dioxygenase domain-containing protein n=1 Tax=Papaver somniferum TaxID=3469 RepID=A0A4Y7IGV9_PAPSO|nr:protein DMR6-LIKE OXYGENASE 2-like [Papaver somniferum]RZC46922.1 hypothetical protein C5167_039866 [Papaver somniferum]
MGIMIKDLIESTDLISLSSKHALSAKADDFTLLAEEEVEQVTLPVIDFSLLTTGSTDQRSKIIEGLRTACLHWGFFMVTNHGVPEGLKEELIKSCMNFFDLSPEEKSVYDVENAVDPCILDPILCGTNFNPASESVSFWRDYLRVLVHPVFHSPPKPEGLSEVLSEYSKRSRDITKELLKAIMEGLELEEDDIEKSLELKSGVQKFSANLYPPCPQPKLAIGLPPHADHGLLTLLMQNDVGGLQIKNKGKWVAVNAIPNSIMVNIGDHMEVLSNGKYKTVVHRAVVNNKETRISLVMTNGPPTKTAIS